MRFTGTLAAVTSAFVVCIVAFGAQGTQVAVGVYVGVGNTGIIEALNDTDRIEARALEAYSHLDDLADLFASGGGQAAGSPRVAAE